MATATNPLAFAFVALIDVAALLNLARVISQGFWA